MKLLILGASGMLGSTLYRYFAMDPEISVYGTIRSSNSVIKLLENDRCKVIENFDVQDEIELVKLIESIRPSYVFNCIGVVKQLESSLNPLVAIPINSLLPHRIYQICLRNGSFLIHFSTDCVFKGFSGGYTESSVPDAYDLYGRSKLLGEINLPGALTLRTSIIGHELFSKRSLVNWFLSQTGEVAGYSNAIFSGLPTVEVARIIKEFIFNNSKLSGLYHLSAEPISKFDLLLLIREVYKKDIRIKLDDSVVIDRSLNSDRFRQVTGFFPDSWLSMIERMYLFN